jgi:hypothetical protein
MADGGCSPLWCFDMMEIPCCGASTWDMMVAVPCGGNGGWDKKWCPESDGTAVVPR